MTTAGVDFSVADRSMIQSSATSRTTAQVKSPWTVAYSNRAAAFRGFDPGGLFNVCPQALARPAPSSRAGQTPNKPKP
jgi:hypothetical protein